MTEVQMTEGEGPGADGLRARVILQAGDRQHYSYDRTEDTRSALARGLKEWLEQVSINWKGGRLLRFKNVITNWGDAEEPALYPSLAIVGAEEATYEDSTMTPKLIKLDAENGDGSGRFLRAVAELRQEFLLIVWTTDKQERSGLTAALEDMLDPAEFMSGLRLELPYYFNARATYEKLGVDYDDSPGSGQQRWRRAIVRVSAHLEQLRPVGDLPYARTRLDGKVLDGAEQLDGTKLPAPVLPGDPPLDLEGVLINARGQ